MTYLFQNGVFKRSSTIIDTPYSTTVTDDGGGAGTITIDLDNGSHQRIIAGTDVTSITVGNSLSGSTSPGLRLTLEVVQPAAGSATVTWGDSVKWPADTPPTLSGSVNDVDLFEMTLAAIDGTNYLLGKHRGTYGAAADPEPILIDDLNHWYKLPDSTDNGTAKDTATNAETRIDLTKSNVTTSAAARWYPPDFSSSVDAYSFNGLSSYASAAAAASNSMATMSVSCWVNADSWPDGNYNSIAWCNVSSSAWSDGWRLYIDDSGNAKFSTGSYTNAATAGSTVSTYMWMLVVGIITPSIIRCYVAEPGQTASLSASSGGSATSPGTGSGSNNITVGCAGWIDSTLQLGRYWDGKLSGLRIYATELSESNILTIAQGDYP